MADQNYKLLIQLLIRDQLSGGLKKALGNMRGFGAESKKALREYGQFRSGVAKGLQTSNLDRIGAKYRAATKEIRAFSRAQSQLSNRASRPASTAGLDRQLQQLRAYRRELQAVNRESGMTRAGGRGGAVPVRPAPVRGADLPFDEGQQPRRGRRGRRGFGERMADAGDTFMAARQVGDVWRDRVDSLRSYTDAATALIRSEARLKMVGLTAEQLATSFAVINKTASAVPSVSRKDLTEGFLDVYTTLNDVNQAAKALPSAARYMTTFRSFFQDQFGREGANRQLQSSYKALEYIGATNRGEAEMDKVLQEFVRITASTGGRVTPDDLLVALRRGKTSTKGFSAVGMRNFASTIEDFGAPTAGTAQMSLYSSLVAGRIDNPALALFSKYGLIKPGGMEFTKAGLPKRVKPGGNILGPLLQEDPMKAAGVLLEHLRKGGVDVENENKLREVTSIMFGNRNAFAMMDMYLTQRKQIEKEAGRMGVSADNYQQQRMLEVDPDMKKLLSMEKHTAQMENFRVMMGQNLLPVATQVMDALNPLLSFFGQHPTIATWTTYLLVGGKVLSGFAETASILGRTGSSVYGFFSRATAGADSLAGGLSRAEQRATGMRGAWGKMNAMPAFMKWTISLAVVGYTVDQVLELLEARKEFNKTEKNLDQVGAMTAKGRTRTEQVYKEQGQAIPKALNVETAQSVFQQLQGGNRWLEYLLAPDRMSLKERAVTLGGTLNPLISDMAQYSEPLFKYHRKVGGEFDPWQRPGVPGPNQRARELGDYNRLPVQEALIRSLQRRAPVLGQSPDIMAEFRKQIAKQNFSAPQKQGFENVLQYAFPESFKKSSELMGQQLGQLPPMFKSFGEGLQGAGDSAVKSFDATQKSALRAAGSLDLLSFKIENWQPPNINWPTVDGQPQPIPSPKTGIPFLDNIPKSARGSVVNRDGLLYGHRGNVVFPASLSRQAPGDWLSSAQALKQESLASMAHGALSHGALSSLAHESLAATVSESRNETHFHNTFHITGNAKDADVIASAILEKMQAQLAEHDQKINDVRHFDKMAGRALTRGRDRE